MKWILPIVAFSLLFLSCSRRKCCEPPQSDSNWKITKRFGGISASEVPLTEDQKNNVLTINPNGNFICRNMVTGTTFTGTYSYSNFNSIYGDRLRYLFSPKLPMLTEEYLILMDNPSGKMVFGDNFQDGYSTTFELIP